MKKDETKPPKKKYQPPRLIRYGDLYAVTRMPVSKGGTKSDGSKAPTKAG